MKNKVYIYDKEIYNEEKLKEILEGEAREYFERNKKVVNDKNFQVFKDVPVEFFLQDFFDLEYSNLSLIERINLFYKIEEDIQAGNNFGEEDQPLIVHITVEWNTTNDDNRCHQYLFYTSNSYWKDLYKTFNESKLYTLQENLLGYKEYKKLEHYLLTKYLANDPRNKNLSLKEIEVLPISDFKQLTKLFFIAIKNYKKFEEMDKIVTKESSAKDIGKLVNLFGIQQAKTKKQILKDLRRNKK